MLVRLWDMKKLRWEVHQVEVPGRPKKGPHDEYLSVAGMKVKPDQNGDFINPDYSEAELDAVHAFAVARLTINLWEKALGRQIQWSWKIPFLASRLCIDLYDPFVEALFKIDERSAILGVYGPERLPTRRSFDIVSHETTHAIIHSVRSEKDKRRTKMHWAVEEAMCDLTPMLLLFSMDQFRHIALQNTDENLRRPNIISEFSEGFSNNGKAGIRSAICFDENDNSLAGIRNFVVNNVYEKMVRYVERSDHLPNDLQFFDLIKTIFQPLLISEELTVKKYLDSIG